MHPPLHPVICLPCGFHCSLLLLKPSNRSLLLLLVVGLLVLWLLLLLVVGLLVLRLQLLLLVLWLLLLLVVELVVFWLLLLRL